MVNPESSLLYLMFNVLVNLHELIILKGLHI